MSKCENSYCFYMANGEHINVEADKIDIMDDCVLLYTNSSKFPFMQVSKAHLMAWEKTR